MSGIFPVSPILGQQFPVADPKWEFNGDKWSLISKLDVNTIIEFDNDSSYQSGQLVYDEDIAIFQALENISPGMGLPKNNTTGPITYPIQGVANAFFNNDIVRLFYRKDDNLLTMNISSFNNPNFSIGDIFILNIEDEEFNITVANINSLQISGYIISDDITKFEDINGLKTASDTDFLYWDQFAEYKSGVGSGAYSYVGDLPKTFIKSEFNKTDKKITLTRVNSKTDEIDLSQFSNTNEGIVKFDNTVAYDANQLVIDSDEIVYKTFSDVEAGQGEPSDNTGSEQTFNSFFVTLFGDQATLFYRTSNNSLGVYVDPNDFPIIEPGTQVTLTIGPEVFITEAGNTTNGLLFLFGLSEADGERIRNIPGMLQNTSGSFYYWPEIAQYSVGVDGNYKVVGNLPDSFTGLTLSGNNLILTRADGRSDEVNITTVSHPLEWSDIILNYTPGTEGTDATDADGNTDAAYIEYTKESTDPTFFRIFNKTGLSEIIRQTDKNSGDIIATKTY